MDKVDTIIRSTFEKCLVFLHADDVSLSIHPDHHHLTAEPSFVFATLLQPRTQLRVFGCEVSTYFLMELHVEEAVHFPDLSQSLCLFWQHCSKSLCSIGLIDFAIELPFLYNSLSKKFFFFLSQSVLSLLILLLNAG